LATPTVSTTTNFNLEIDEIVREAQERVGGEWTTANEQISGRRSLNLLFIDLQNRGFPLAKLEYVTGTLTNGVSTFEMETNVADLLSVSISLNDNDIELEKISYSDWLNINNKEQPGRPTQVLVERQRANVKLTFWPVPNLDDYTFKTWAIKRITDVTKGFQYADLSYRYLTAITSGLAFYLATKRDGVPEEKIARLRSQYLEDLEFAREEDRERINYTAIPQIASLF
jgi:hypothetical protein